MQVSSYSIQQRSISIPEEKKSIRDHMLMDVVAKVSSIEKFINELNNLNITYEELDDACQWAHWDNKELTSILEEDDCTYPPLVQSIKLQLHAILNVCLLKKTLQKRYPNEKVELNKEFTPALSTWKTTRNWCTIGGVNAKEFDDQHGDGKPINL